MDGGGGGVGERWRAGVWYVWGLIGGVPLEYNVGSGVGWGRGPAHFT